MNTELTPEVSAALAAALEPYAARIKSPEARADVAALWAKDFAGVAPGLVPDLVRARVNDPRFAHYFNPADPAAEAAAARRTALTEQLRGHLGRQPAGDAPGLAGTYGRRP